MPLYDFKCEECEHEFEEQVKLEKLEAEPDHVECPSCGEAGCKRMITNPRHYSHVSWSKWRAGHK
jgi:putative FmdB family regulatory protein